MSVRVVQDTNLAGLTALAKRLDTMGQRVMVGVPASAKEADGTPIALIAAVHEFGSPKLGIPERSFLRAGIQKNRQQFTRLNFTSLRRVANANLTIREALDLLGLYAASAVKREIVEGNFKPNAPATIKAKGSDKPLIDSGAMRQAITWTVERTGA